jgi:hypothetical protein
MTARSTASRLDPVTRTDKNPTHATDHNVTRLDLTGQDVADPPHLTRTLPDEIGTAEARVAVEVPDRSFRIVTRSEAGVPVLGCAGDLDAVSLRACATALAACLPMHPAWIVADLRQADISRESLAVLTLMRRYVERGGAQLVLVSTDPEQLRILRDANLAGLYRVGSTVPQAIEAPGPPSRRRRTATP